MCRWSLSSSPSTAGIKCSLFFLLCHPTIHTMEFYSDWPLSCLFTERTQSLIDKIQTKFRIFQIDKWFPGVLILTNVISHNGGWATGGMFDVGDTDWLVLLELTHDLHLLMSLYMRDTRAVSWHSNICRCSNNIITDILGIVGSWECCTALSPIVEDQWKISTKPALPVLDFNTGIIILLEVNIETLWCSCPVRRLVLVMVDGTRQLSMHFTSP